MALLLDGSTEYHALVVMCAVFWSDYEICLHRRRHSRQIYRMSRK